MRPAVIAASRGTAATRTGGAGADAIVAAPHVRAAVEAACGPDASAVERVLAALDPEQRRGWRILPEPLPVGAAQAAPVARELPREVDPDEALALALCGTGRVRALCAIAGSSPEGLAASPLSVHVELHGGSFRFADPALRTKVLARSTTPQRIRAHRSLAAILAEAGEEEAALYHRARGAVIGTPELVEPLMGQACAALRAGDAARAWSRASEAAEHAEQGSPAHARALLCGGRAALAGGWVADAQECSERALRIDGGHRGEAAAAFVLAHTLRHGALPASDPLIPADARATTPTSCDALAGDPGAAGIDDAEVSRGVARALRAGLDGDPDAGMRMLAETRATAGADRGVGRCGQGPLLRACRAVAEVMLHVWAGRMGAAHELLAISAAELPVALPFGGLAVALSRRLDLAVNGAIGPLSRDLAAAVPWSLEPDGFVDRAIDAYLHGRSDEAAVHMGLWADRGRPSEALGVPGLDEIGPRGAGTVSEPPETTIARALRARVRAARESCWRTDLDAVAEESRGIRSPFERARVEALLGSTYAARGDQVRGVRYLRAARSLFEESGARAWRGMVDRRLRAMAAPRPSADAVSGSTAGSSSLEVCRAMWESILTARELEVALLMADGRTNREIALTLHVSVRTVEVHGGRIFAKLDVRTRHELTVLAHRTDQHL